MPGSGAHGAAPQAPAPEHARHRAPRGTAARRRAVVAALALVAAAAVVVPVALLRQPPSGTSATGTTSTSSSSSASGGWSGAAGAPAAGSAAGGGSGTGPSSSSTGPSAGAAQAAAVWLAGQPAPAGGVAVDPGLYDALASSAQLASRLVPAPTASADPALPARWVVAGPALRAEAAPGSWAAQALASSRSVAVFGDGDGRVEVRELAGASAGAEPVVPLAAGTDATTSPPVTSAPAPATATAADAAALEELQRNTRLDFSPRAREALRTQPVDLRLAALLVQLAAQQPLSVADLPSSGGGGEPVRTAVVDGLGGRPVGADPDAVALLQRQLTAQDTPYRATAALEDDGGTRVLRVVLPSAGV